ncbi:MAG: hypothetical protein ISR69_10280 [Gammaproteobacteria bacterium]|nr:hypothetical protein [Gammaproteobacteria bacterium]
MPTGYRNYLSLKHEHKTIPYGGVGKIREDGDANYGFKNIKGNNRLLDTIPELKSDPALMTLVKAINAPNTGLISIGCVSDRYEDKNRFRHSGYVEFSFNSTSYIADAAHYFPLFFNFEHLLEKNDFTVKVEFNWSIQPATFIDKNVTGYSCTIYLNTYLIDSEKAAIKAWEETLNLLAQYLGNIPVEHTDYIFAI